MKLIFATTMLLCASAVAANAETFTFTSTTHTTNAVMVSGMGATPIGAIFGEGQSVNVDTSGKKTTNTSRCASWTPEPGSQFNVIGVCTFGENAKDQSSLAFSCVSDMKTNVGDCWGGLKGISGRYAGRTGTISWHQTGTPDGKGGSAAGTGQWN